MNNEIDLESFRAGGRQPKNITIKKKTKRLKPFLRGPIPMDWLAQATTIPRRNAIVVGIVLWWLAGMRSERVGLVLCAGRCKEFGLGCKAVGRGLRDLEQAGLIRVERSQGKCARVDLLQCSE